jgi:2-keto-4-pentenoate hydratase/2-oxohepta-3-ene-1,7-dioic acid hydratase in catechol pathway
MILNDSIKYQSIYCIGRNYKAHILELGNQVTDVPVVFLKSNSSLRGAKGDLAFSEEVFHHEAELIVKIGDFVPMGSAPGLKAAKELSLGLDLTRRDIQSKLKEKGLPWTLAKSFKGSAVIGPWIPVPPDLNSLEFTLHVGGDLKQTGHTSLMIFSFDQIINYLSSFQDLVPGDLIFTGTPEGVGPIRVGDSFVLSIKSLGYEFHGEL